MTDHTHFRVERPLAALIPSTRTWELEFFTRAGMYSFCMIPGTVYTSEGDLTPQFLFKRTWESSRLKTMLLMYMVLRWIKVFEQLNSSLRGHSKMPLLLVSHLFVSEKTADLAPIRTNTNL